MKIGNTIIDDTYAEGFSMRYTRLLVTAIDRYWLEQGVREFCGYGTSVIHCDAEVGVETAQVEPQDTVDGRVGATVMAFTFSADALAAAVGSRAGQCLLTCPTTAVFNGMEPTQTEVPLGNYVRYFGDRFEEKGTVGQRQVWRIPVMEGEFLIEDKTFSDKGVGGGNFLIQSVDVESGLAAARRAVDEIAKCSGVITPFPGGVVRSGSKVGSKYKALRASTFDAYCPTLRDQVESRIHAGANCVYEIVIDGVDFDSVAQAMKVGIQAAVDPNHAGDSIVAISAGNYDGDLGKHHFPLRSVLE